MTDFWTRISWRTLIFVHRRSSIHRLLSLAGPAYLFTTIVLWYFVHTLAWTLIFWSEPGSIVDGTTRLPADLGETFYFVGTTVSSLGFGDFVPVGSPWSWLSNLSCFSSTVILTVSLSYVLAVLGAALDKQVFAEAVFGLGESVESFVSGACLGDVRASLKDYILKLASDLDKNSHRHLAYPILHFFHSPRLRNSTSRAVLLLADAFFVLEQLEDAQQRPPRGLLRLVQSSVSNFIRLTDTNLAISIAPTDHQATLGHIARRLGVVSMSQFDAQLEKFAPLRHQLLLLCAQDGWEVTARKE